MEKKAYQKPAFTVVNFKAEQGFAQSGTLGLSVDDGLFEAGESRSTSSSWSWSE